MAVIKEPNYVQFGEADRATLAQMIVCRQSACSAALMADNHVGYAVPIGSVLAYEDALNISGVGFDIACGNKAVRLDIPAAELQQNIASIMDAIFETLSFGIGRRNTAAVQHAVLDDDPAWTLPVAERLRSLAAAQLGTVGGGNHYVDLFIDELDRVWCGVHFGSRGLGHKMATHFLKLADARDGMNAQSAIVPMTSNIAQEYVQCMQLAGRYAYAGRDWVCSQVASVLGCRIEEEVHNHHNFAWEEEHAGRKLWVVRKGATPLFPGQRGFVGGSMGDESVILEGIDSTVSREALYSTVHGAGRVMSRTEASGGGRWKKRKTAGRVTREMMERWVTEAGVELRGGGVDESPHCYRRLPQVLSQHAETLRIVHRLRPVGVAMAPADETDPYKD